MAANAEDLDLPPASADLLLCNEVIGDFTTVKLTREAVGLTREVEPSAAYATWTAAEEKRLGESGRLIRKYVMPLRDAPDELYFNVGAVRFVERVEAVLREGGTALITEYGDPMRYPVPSTQLDHIEFSIHFGLLAHVARHLGMRVSIEYVQDILQADREARTLETTRTYFLSLRAMLASFGIELRKIAYTDQSFAELLGERLRLEHIGDVRFRVFDERCMGLAPHEFKALLVRKTGEVEIEL